MSSGGASGTARRLTGADVALVFTVVLVLLALRCGLLLTALPEVYAREYSAMGLLALDIEAGQAQTSSLSALQRLYQYGDYAQGTLATGLVTAALAVPLGANGWALHGSTLLFECLTVALLALLFLKLMDRRFALLALVPILLPPWFAAEWQLMPYGNHTEFLWVPVGLVLYLAARDPQQRPIWHWLAPAGLLAIGLVLYRLNIACAAALAAAALSRLRPRTALLGAGTTALAIGVTRRAAGSGLGLTHLPEGTFDALRPSHVAEFFWTYIPYARTDLADPYRLALLALPLAAAIAAWRSRRHRVPAVFAIVWAVAALGAPLVLEQPMFRYQLQTLYALLLCGGVALAASSGIWRVAVAASLLFLGFAGAQDQWRHVDASQWRSNAGADTLALGLRLGVYHFDADDLPYYQRMLDEGRWHPATGSIGYPLDPNDGPDDQHPGFRPKLYMSGDGGGTESTGLGLHDAWTWAGRGAWISGDRDLETLWPFWGTFVPEPERTWLWEGAVAEAAVWGVEPPAGVGPEAEVEEEGEAPVEDEADPDP